MGVRSSPLSKRHVFRKEVFYDSSNHRCLDRLLVRSLEMYLHVVR